MRDPRTVQMCTTGVQPSPPGAQLWPRGHTCGQPALPDVRFGCGGKESPGAPEDPWPKMPPLNTAFIPSSLHQPSPGVPTAYRQPASLRQVSRGVYM